MLEPPGRIVKIIILEPRVSDSGDLSENLQFYQVPSAVSPAAMGNAIPEPNCLRVSPRTKFCIIFHSLQLIFNGKLFYCPPNTIIFANSINFESLKFSASCEN